MNENLFSGKSKCNEKVWFVYTRVNNIRKILVRHLLQLEHCGHFYYKSNYKQLGNVWLLLRPINYNNIPKYSNKNIHNIVILIIGVDRELMQIISVYIDFKKLYLTIIKKRPSLKQKSHDSLQ